MSVLIGSAAGHAGIKVDGLPGAIDYIQFYQENDGIAFGSGANIDDLLSGDCTIECWFRVPAWPAAGAVYLLAKASVTNGWSLTINTTGNLIFFAQYAANVLQIVSPGTIAVDTWYHAALDWDVGTLTGRLFLSGVSVGTDGAAGAYQTDAALSLFVNGFSIGGGDQSMDIGWIRLSTVRYYTGASFTRPERNAYPAADANTQLLIYMNDGAGVTATDYSGNGYNGTITFGTSTRWARDSV
jgi:hypothetical protein